MEQESNVLDFGFYNMDCMDGMKQFPDNYFDLAVVDPPYGAGFTEGGGSQGWFSKYHQHPELTTNKRLRFHGSNVNPNDQWYKYTHDEDGNEKIISWDVAPDKTYFDELFRVSKNQVIWGGQLLCPTAYKMLLDMEKTYDIRIVFYGYG